jgi:hypothetical protein
LVNDSSSYFSLLLSLSRDEFILRYTINEKAAPNNNQDGSEQADDRDEKVDEEFDDRPGRSNEDIFCWSCLILRCFTGSFDRLVPSIFFGCVNPFGIFVDFVECTGFSSFDGSGVVDSLWLSSLSAVNVSSVCDVLSFRLRDTGDENKAKQQCDLEELHF